MVVDARGRLLNAPTEHCLAARPQGSLDEIAVGVSR
jgi:hypothetical protein